MRRVDLVVIMACLRRSVGSCAGRLDHFRPLRLIRAQEVGKLLRRAGDHLAAEVGVAGLEFWQHAVRCRVKTLGDGGRRAARTRPARTCGSTAVVLLNSTWISPAMSAATEGPEPL